MDFQYLYEHPKLNSVIHTLLQSFIREEALCFSKIQKDYSTASWIATQLSNSEDALHKKKSFLFASLSKKLFHKNKSIECLCFTIFARTGNIPATKHLSLLFQSGNTSRDLIGALELELIAAYSNSISKISKALTLTTYQAKVEEALEKDATGLFSAPTSAGKSFIVHEYVKYKLKGDNNFLCLFIVPTKALISQVSSIYRTYRQDEDLAFDIYTSIPDTIKINAKCAIFCLTQERCIKILSSPLRSKLSFVFVDEIQKVEDNSRGALLEYVINELQRTSPQAQMFFAGPYISNTSALAASLNLDIKESIDTEDSPVSQIVLLVKAIRNKKIIQLKLLTENEKNIDTSFTYDTEKFLYSRWRTQTTAISDAIKIFGHDSSVIIYAPGPGTARNWAVAYTPSNVANNPINQDIQELIEYTKDSIHPQCSLIDCLKKGVAFHHGKLPDFIREEIEALYSARTISTLFCTSTLLEGVNLPAEKIFVIKPTKGEEDLSLFEFRNLIGRAGRLGEHLNGIVYCIQTSGTEDEDWLTGYKDFKSTPVESSVDINLQNNFDVISHALNNDIILPNNKNILNIKNTLTILRSRFAIDTMSGNQYISRKPITKSQQQYLITALINSTNKLSIPKDLIERNPYIDPLLQDKLYLLVSSSPHDWLIRRTTGFSEDFSKVFLELDKIFHIVEECRPQSKLEFQDDVIINYAKDWLNGKNFNIIVGRAIPSKFKSMGIIPYKVVDKAVHDALQYITKDVSYVTAKYFSVLSEILKSLPGIEVMDAFNFTTNLPVMLELGSRNPKELSLIAACIPRSAALKISSLIPDVDDPVEWLTANQDKRELMNIPRIYQKILKRAGIWR